MNSRYANVSEVPLALAVWLASDFYDHNDDPLTVSATTLLKPLRQIILPPRIPEGERVISLPDMMNSRMGTAIHDSIEKAWMTNHKDALQLLGLPKSVIERVAINPEVVTDGMIPVYMEQRLTRKIGKWTVTGKFDFIGEGRVQDFKSTGTYSYTKQVNGDKYTKQGSIYRWLDPQKITDSEMDIHYIFTDWKPMLAKSDQSYPQRRFIKQSFPLMSLAETEMFITRKLALIEQYWTAPEEEIPECSDEDLWRSEPVFKYYKNPEKTQRSTKNFETKHDAYIRLAEDGNVGIVKEVPGQVTACRYCNSFVACTQKDKLIAAGDLIL
jgi:hypothetical protein